MNALLRLLLMAVLLYPTIGFAQAAPSGINLSLPTSTNLSPASTSDNANGNATAMANSRVSMLRWVAIGAGVGAIVGLGAYAVVDGQLPDYCNEGEPGCTAEQNYSRRGFVVSFAAAGAFVGAVLGARSSRQAAAPR